MNQPHAIRFSKEYAHELKCGTSWAGYLASEILSPDERDIVLQFRTAGAIEFYLNGQRVEEMPGEPEEGIHPLFRRARQTARMRLHAGKNHLLISTESPKDEDRFWFFGGALTTPDNEFITDLGFEV